MKKIILITILLLITGLLYADGYLFLDVDGIKVEITEINFRKNYSNSENVGTISLNRTVNLTGDPNDVFSGGVTLMLDSGYETLDFDHINIDMYGGVAIKGHVYDPDTVGTHYYTTASGVGSINLGSSTWVEPVGYDYLQNDYFYYPSDGGRQGETTFMTSEVSYDPALGIDINLLVDTYKVAYYWNGNHADRHSFVETVPYHEPSAFPSGTPVIGVTYLPFYVSVNRNVTSETYVVTSSISHPGAFSELSDGIIDEKLSMIVTFVFDEDTGEFYIGRTANWDGLDDYNLNLPQFVRSGTLSGGSYTFSLSEYDNSNGGWTTAQSISGFTRQTLGAEGTATVSSSDSSDYTLHYYRVQ